MLNLGKFHNLVRLVAFSPFASSQVALENANAVSEGEGERHEGVGRREEGAFSCHPFALHLGVRRIAVKIAFAGAVEILGGV